MKLRDAVRGHWKREATYLGPRAQGAELLRADLPSNELCAPGGVGRESGVSIGRGKIRGEVDSGSPGCLPC